MNARTAFLLATLVTATAGCGPDGPAYGAAAAGLYIPRALADDLVSVTVYVYKVESISNDPTPEELLAPSDALGNYDAYLEYNEFEKVEIAFQTNREAVIKGFPDHDPGWQFYARGYDNNPLLIAHGATAGPVTIYSDSDELNEVEIYLLEIIE